MPGAVEGKGAHDQADDKEDEAQLHEGERPEAARDQEEDEGMGQGEEEAQ